MPRQLNEHLQDIKQQIKTASHVLLCLDYDGTLVPYQEDPAIVRPSPQTIELLEICCQKSKFTLCIITGRTLQYIQQVLPIDQLITAALHGIQIHWPNKETFTWVPAEKPYPIFKNIKNNFPNDFRNFDGAWLEEKSISLAFHFRSVPEKFKQQAQQKYLNLVEQHDPHHQLNQIHGEQVIELCPKGWDKGKAVEYLLKRLPEQTLPLYIGDDTTDEDAFSFISTKGISIWVSHRRKQSTAAQYMVETPDDVHVFLEELCATDNNSSSE